MPAFATNGPVGPAKALRTILMGRPGPGNIGIVSFDADAGIRPQPVGVIRSSPGLENAISLSSGQFQVKQR